MDYLLSHLIDFLLAFVVFYTAPKLPGLLSRARFWVLDYLARASRQQTLDELAKLERELADVNYQVANPSVVLGWMIIYTMVMVFSLGMMLLALDVPTNPVLSNVITFEKPSDQINLVAVFFSLALTMLIAGLAVMIGYPGYAGRRKRLEKQIASLKAKLK